MSTEVKQEGDFKIKKRTPKKLVGKEDIIKVDLSKPAVELKKEEDAIQKQSADEVPVRNESETSEGIREGNEQPTDEKSTRQDNSNASEAEVDSPIQVIEDEEDNSEEAGVDRSNEASSTVSEQKEVLSETKAQKLPEGVEKLIKFMEETGGTVEDYVSLNRDVSKMDNTSLLREYYKQSKPHLDSDDVEFLLNKNFGYDGDADDPQEIKAKQLAFKEELFNAQNHFNSSKDKYYADLKLRKQNDMSPEQREAIEYYDSYKQQKAESEVKINEFKLQTDKVFNNDFKGFDFKVGENKYRYKVDNPQKVKEFQYSINNWIETHLDKSGNIKNVPNYHKALFTAQNADKIAGHFYEQGRADAIRESAKKAKNINMDPRKDNASMPKNNTSGIRAISNNNDNPNKLRVKWNK